MRLDKRGWHVINKPCPKQIFVVFLPSVGAHRGNPHELTRHLSFLNFHFSHSWKYFLENTQTTTKWKFGVCYVLNFRNVNMVRASIGLSREPSGMSIPCTTEGLLLEYEIPYLKNPPCFWKQIVYEPVNHCSVLLGATKIQKYNLKEKLWKKEVYLQSHTWLKASQTLLLCLNVKDFEK